MTQDDPDNFDRLIDPVIDDVARAMTAARADEAFARRVSVRLQDQSDRAPWTWPRAWLLAPAAGAVLLALLATSLLRDGNIRPAPADVLLKPDATEKASAANAAAGAIAKPETVEPVATRTTNTARTPVPPAAASSAVEPLVTPPIEFAALDVSPLVTVMPIEIQAIAIERIEIAPMP